MNDINTTDTQDRTFPRLWTGLFLLAVAPFAYLVHRLWFLCDDAFISFRYAQNWAAGLGLRFNPGDQPPVEGFSNFSWTALMALIDCTGLKMARVAPWISALLGALLLYILFRFLRTRFSRSPAAVLLGLLCVALSPVYATWCTGGLETMLFSLLLFLAYLQLLAGPVRPIRAGIWSGLLCLTRPEGILWVLGLAVCYILFNTEPTRKKLKNLALYLGMVLVLFLPYFVARYLYFGYPLPNTYYAKSALSMTSLHRGFNYTMSYLLCFITPLVLVAGTPMMIMKKAPVAIRSAALISLGFLIYATFAGGDFMAMARFMAPSIAFLGIAAAYLTQTLLQKIAPSVRGPVLGGALILGAIQILPAFNLEPLPQAIRNCFHFRWNLETSMSELDFLTHMKRNRADWTVIGKTLKQISKPGDSVVVPGIGAIGYYSGLHIHDMCGLVDPVVAHRKADYPYPRSPGHDKFVVPEFFLNRKPTFMRLQRIPPQMQKEAVQALRQLLPSGYEVKTIPLTGDKPDGGIGSIVVMQKRILKRRAKHHSKE